MKKLTYRGYTISQTSNNHIMITKNNKMVFHASLTKKLNEEELKVQIDWFINVLLDSINEECLNEQDN